MKVVLLAGGFGTRISEESQFKPKPMIEIGGMPILWHIMKEYSYFGHTDFIICAGYKQEYIKEWFANFGEWISNLFQNIAEGIGNFVSNLVEGISNIFKKIWEVGKNIGQGSGAAAQVQQQLELPAVTPELRLIKIRKARIGYVPGELVIPGGKKAVAAHASCSFMRSNTME